MLTPREATEGPTQRSGSPLSPTEVTELATVRVFLILSALLCSLRPGFCIVCDFSHARPIMLQHSTSYYGPSNQLASQSPATARACALRVCTLITTLFVHMISCGTITLTIFYINNNEHVHKTTPLSSNPPITSRQAIT